jgi:hypothetical protein
MIWWWNKYRKEKQPQIKTKKWEKKNLKNVKKKSKLGLISGKIII